MRINTLRIEVDDRERNPLLLETLANCEGVELTTMRLTTGDFRIDEAVLFERKTAADFVRSLVDGRLFRQASQLVRQPERTALLLEGSAREWRELTVRRESIQGALLSLGLIFDIPVFRSISAEESARLLYYTGQQLLRSRTDGQVPHRKIKAKRRSTRRKHLLMALPGIGPERAQRLLARFGSVRECLQADEKLLQTVEGIGPSIAQAIVETVEESPCAYQSFHNCLNSPNAGRGSY